MQLLSGGPPNGSTPTPVQSGTWSPPLSVDLPQLSHLALYDGSGSAGALTFDDKDSIGPKLAEEEARLARTYHDAGDIDADVNAMQANINALIEDMGLDAGHAHPLVGAGAGGGGEETSSSAPAGADFDFDAFLTAFANDQDGVAVPLPLPTSVSADLGITNPADDHHQPVVAGRKRTSDAAELTFPSPAPLSASVTPTLSSSRLRTTAESDGTSVGSPRAKRNKK